MQIRGELEKKFIDYSLRYKNALKKKIEIMKLKFEKCMSLRVFREPMQNINEKYMLIDIQVRNIRENMMNKLKSEKSRQMELISKLDGLSPLKTLTRGYSIVQSGDHVIKSSKELKQGDEISIRFSDGNTNAKIL